VIVVAEGPSAAGKTTWCHAHGDGLVVPEHAPRAGDPDGHDLPATAKYWTAVNCGRWAQAVQLESEHGLAICDGDPLKLHYAWCLARIGATPLDGFRHEAHAVRESFAAGRLGIADVILLSFPSSEELRRRRSADPTRSRRNFDLHLRLAEPLREWYAAMATLDADDRIRWGLPPTGMPDDLPPPRPKRSDPAMLDRLFAALPVR
jgi:hypothetical protein